MEIQNSNEIGISVVGDFTIRYTVKKDAENIFIRILGIYYADIYSVF